MLPKLHRSEVLVIDRSAIKRKHLVYLFCATKTLKYPEGRSSIVYIGGTSKGVKRIAWSAAVRAKKILSTRGIRKFGARVVSYPQRRGPIMWKSLEKDLIKSFKSRYGSIPLVNHVGRKFKAHKLSGHFNPKRLQKILDHFEK